MSRESLVNPPCCAPWRELDGTVVVEGEQKNAVINEQHTEKAAEPGWLRTDELCLQ
jgi:hypothetical protein